MLLALPSISYVVARSFPGFVIGNENRLPWHLRSDLRRFKEITYGHPIIMGRNTHLSIGRPLPGRINIVLSRSVGQTQETDLWQTSDTALVWAGDLPSALYFADVVAIARGLGDVFVIGGAQMYKMFDKLFNKIYLTEVLTGRSLQGDAQFRFRIDKRKWETCVDRSLPAGPDDEYPSRFRILNRKRKWVRYVEINDFFTGSGAKDLWVSRQLDLFEGLRANSRHKPFIVPYQYRLFELPAAA